MKLVEECTGVGDLSGQGDIKVLAPADVQRLDFAGWPESVSGKLSQDVTFVVRYDRFGFTVEAAVTVTAAMTADNTSVADLIADLTAALESATFTVVQTDDPKVVEYAARYEKMSEQQKKLIMDKLRELKREIFKMFQPDHISQSAKLAKQKALDIQGLFAFLSLKNHGV